MSNESRTLQTRLRAEDLRAWLPSMIPNKARFGVTKLARPVSIGFYDAWLAAGHHGEMSYLERHRDLKADPQTWLAFARSAIVFALDYYPANTNYVTGLRTAAYTKYRPRQVDYHDAIRAELQPILEELQRRYPGSHFRFALDAEPVLERDLAARAGLGWVGKNSCVIDRNGGSLFFIAEILSSLETDEVAIQSPDHCGTCTRCMDSCPTSALIEPRKLDATKCISYWTIEAKGVPPRGLRDKFGDWFFGCDICQSVCPWNGKVFGRENMDALTTPETRREDVIQELRHILEASNRELQRRFESTPLARARGFGLKRNALVVASNLGLYELLPTLLQLSEKLPATDKLRPLVLETIEHFKKHRV